MSAIPKLRRGSNGLVMLMIRRSDAAARALALALSLALAAVASRVGIGRRTVCHRGGIRELARRRASPRRDHRPPAGQVRRMARLPARHEWPHLRRPRGVPGCEPRLAAALRASPKSGKRNRLRHFARCRRRLVRTQPAHHRNRRAGPPRRTFGARSQRRGRTAGSPLLGRARVRRSG